MGKRMEWDLHMFQKQSNIYLLEDFTACVYKSEHN